MDTVIRVVIVYIALLAGLRTLGKRELSQLSSIELVSLLIISELVSQALQNQDFSLTNAAVAVCTLFTLVVFTSALGQVSKRAQKVIEGRHTVLLHDGTMIERSLRRERITPDEIATAARLSGVEDVSQVKWAILETDGKISIVPKDPSPNVSSPNEPELAGG